MSYDIVQYISNNFNNSSLNVALPVILNGIETLAITEKTNQGHNLPLEAYKLLRECFYEFYEIEVNDNTKTSWRHFYSYLEKFQNNFLAQEIIFTPVLRIFILKQMGILDLNQYELMEKALKEIDQTIKDINEEINPDNVANTYSNLTPDIQIFLINFFNDAPFLISLCTINTILTKLEQEKIKLTEEIKEIKDIIFIDDEEYIGNFKPVSIDQANKYLYQPFGIDCYLSIPEEPLVIANAEKNAIFIMQSSNDPNKFLINAKAYDISFKDLENTYNRHKEYINNFCKEIYLVLFAPKIKNSKYTELMLEVLQWYINDNLIPNKAVEKILNQIYLIDKNYHPKRIEDSPHGMTQSQGYEFTEEEIQTFLSNTLNVSAYEDEVLDEDITQQKESTYDNNSLPESIEELDEQLIEENINPIAESICEENTNLEFLQLSLVIGLTILAAITLVMAIIFCPPIGLATAFGLSAGNAWIASGLYSSAGLISGCSALNMFFNHSKLNIEVEAKKNLNNNSMNTTILENVNNAIS